MMSKTRFNVTNAIREDLLHIYVSNHLSFFYIPLFTALVFIFLRFYFLGYIDNDQVIANSLLFFLSGVFFVNQQRLYKRIKRRKGENSTTVTIFKIMINKACYVLPWFFIIFWPYKTNYFFDQSLGFLMIFLAIGFYTSISHSNLILFFYDIALQVVFCTVILLLNWGNIEAPYILFSVLLFTSYSSWIGLKLNRSVSALADKNKQLQVKTDEANKANQAKSDFLAMMSHEIRTPLHGITSTIESLSDTNLNKKQKKSLNVISRCAHILLSMLNNVLDLSKIEAQKIHIEKIEFNFHELISDIIQSNISIAKKKGVTLESKILENVPKFVVSDPVRIHQIILNLTNNALKFTQEGSVRLQASYNLTRHMLTVEIQDTGIGIAEENINRLFFAFEQEESSTARNFGGTGLGLPVVKELTELLEGTVHVESQKGEGSKFTVHIPVLLSSKTENNPKQSLEKNIEFDLKDMRVLVAEDNDINQMNISQTLKKYSCIPDLVSDGLEALNKAEENQYDVILMDMNMPNLNGIEATKKIKQGKNKNAPVIGLSAVTQEEILLEFYKAGIVEHIIKPFDRNTLLSTILCYKPLSETKTTERIDQIYEDFEPSFCRQFVEGSFNEIKRLYSVLQESLAKKDIENIKNISHELCGVAGNVGMYRTYSQSKNIEDLSLGRAEIFLLTTKIEFLAGTIDREIRLIKEYKKDK